MQLKSADYIYILLSCIAGVWQAWCFNYGTNNLIVFIVIAMSLPFAFASYIHASLRSATGNIAERPGLKRIFVLWAGMPLSLVAFSLTVLAETGIMYASGFGIVDLPFDNLRLLIGEGAASFVWAICLLVWGRQSGLRLSRNLLLAIFATLFAGVLFANGLAYLILRISHKDIYVYLESTVVTTISALILVFLRNKAMERGANSDIVSEA